MTGWDRDMAAPEPEADNAPAVVAYLQARGLAPAGLAVRMPCAKAVRAHLRRNGAGHKVVWAVAEGVVVHSDEPHLVVLEREETHDISLGAPRLAFRWAVFYQHPLVAVGRSSKAMLRHVEDEYDLERRVQLPSWDGRPARRDRPGPAARPKPVQNEMTLMGGCA